MTLLDETAQEYLENAKKNHLLRSLKDSSREDGVNVLRGGVKYISFSCNDYLGLSHNASVKKAAWDALEKYGAGSGASRLVTGNNPLYSELEKKLANLKKTESALVFGSGYLANIGTIPALVGRGDLILADKLVHACLLDGAKLSGAKLMRFEHNNVEKCSDILKKNRNEYKNCLIITDHVFSMDGDIAPVDELYKLAKKTDSWLMTDDAHGIGVLSKTHKHTPHIQMGTLSKAVGSYGGYVCASDVVIKFLQNKSRSLVYSTALPPMVLAASLAALNIIENDADLVKKPLDYARYFTSQMGLAEAVSPIVPIIIGDEAKAVSLSEALESEGFLVSAIRPPTVPSGTARLRFTFSAAHNEADIDRLVAVLKRVGV